MNEQGFTILPSVFGPLDLARLDAALTDFWETNRRDSNPREVIFGQKVAERCDIVRNFVQRQEFIDISTAFLGPDTDLYFNQMVYKSPEGNKPFSWHQDDAYGPVEPSPYLTVWMAITDATVENGCVSVLPGSHKQGLMEHHDSEFGLACRSHDDPTQGFLVPVPAGSLICFWSTMMHKSGPNLSSGTRKAFVMQFCPPGTRHKASGMLIKSRIAVARDKKGPRQCIGEGQDPQPT
jgi:ectoine hydroxylase-related dioxygenase (phytanoyl-CoA dioxygenase family)